MPMNITAKQVIAAGVLAYVSQSLIAAEAEESKTWEATAELGFLKTDGNSETETILAKFNGSQTIDLWKHGLKLEALNTSQEDERSAEKYFASVQSDYSISERSYLFATLIWEKDRFSGYDYQASAAAGYGYKVLNSENKKLNLEIAPGYRISELDPGEKEEEAIGRFAENFKWKFSETATLDQSLSSEYGDSNTITRFNIGVSSQIVGNLSMKLGFGLKHNSDVAEGADKTDKETSVSLAYTF